MVSALSTAVVAPRVRSWLRRRQSLDHPNGRSSHTVPTPRGGGLACAAGALAGSLAGRRFGNGPSAEWIGASAALGAVGRLDDMVGLGPLPRLGAQAVAGVLVGARAGGLAGAAFGIVALPAIINAFNFMDGINGISGGTAAAWGLSVATHPTLSPQLRAQGALSAGMGLGFLPYNVPKASMFLGDVGSYLLGSGIAVTVVGGSFREMKPDPRGALSVLAPLALYLADTGSTILRRALRGESVTEAHREHAYQQLVHETGWPHWVVSGFVAGVSVACGMAGRSSYSAAAIAPIVAGYLAAPGLLKRFGSLEPESAQSSVGGRA
ncbi:glycosyltransferase family 4 protein [Dietzia sp. ANT_WB102]|uniref:glycosyltransferase family 4 protein n=1 Tax=Dietzia sp. ANT_WB102 TaxID=2597345 RepID=UPI00351A3C15